MKYAEKAEREKMEILLETIDQHPLTIKVREDKAAEVLATRQGIALKVAALRNEQDLTIPKLQDEQEIKEAKYAEAKAALEGAAEEVRAAVLALRSERFAFDNTIRNCEASLLESADPAIDAAIMFFRDKLDYLRTPGRLSRSAIGAERNLISWKKKTFEENNTQAVHDALRYCQAAITTLESWKLLPELDAEKIAALKAGIPRIDVYMEHTGERSMEKINTDPRSLLPSDSQIEWSIGKLNEKFKKIMGR